VSIAGPLTVPVMRAVSDLAASESSVADHEITPSLSCLSQLWSGQSQSMRHRLCRRRFLMKVLLRSRSVRRPPISPSMLTVPSQRAAAMAQGSVVPPPTSIRGRRLYRQSGVCRSANRSSFSAYVIARCLYGPWAAKWKQNVRNAIACRGTAFSRPGHGSYSHGKVDSPQQTIRTPDLPSWLFRRPNNPNGVS
jgi:hypothetical protein